MSSPSETHGPEAVGTAAPEAGRRQGRPPPGLPPVVAVCGKGGVGKTAVSALLGRALIERGVSPLLLVDADPVGGLGFAVGSPPARTLADVRAHVLEAARGSDEAARQRLAGELDYRLLEVLAEHEDHALLAMGRSGEAGCFCPVNRLLRHAVDGLAAGFAAVLVDAEAGVEQIQREVTRRVDLLLVVVDGSQRSLHTLEVIRELAATTPVAVLANRVPADVPLSLPPSATRLGHVPEDPTLADFDRAGRALWELPADSAARGATRRAADALAETLALRRSSRSESDPGESDHREADHREADHREADHREADHRESDHREADHREADHREADHREADHRESDHREADHRESDHREADHREADHREADHREAGRAALVGRDQETG